MKGGLDMQEDSALRRPGVILTATAIVGATGIGLFSLNIERQHVKALDADHKQVLAELARTSSQIRDTSARLDSLATAISTQRAQSAPIATPRTGSSRSRSSRSQSEEVRLQNLQSQILRQQKELAQAREDIATNHQSLQGELSTAREDLQGKLNSARQELGGSIAKNHDELVVLQKRGERNYYEFDLTKSKDLRRVGPVNLALRKSDAKRKNYTVDMLVEDNRLQKKNVNLYEPVWINLIDRPQPLEIVVNFVGKDEIRGYVSEPKYKRSELAESAPGPVSRQTPLNSH
jgi:DNA repair exonuclease SbcCD ATPase subunit